jgi:hypothetical protein
LEGGRKEEVISTAAADNSGLLESYLGYMVSTVVVAMGPSMALTTQRPWQTISSSTKLRSIIASET